jgi:hypothetical protein
MKPPGAIAVVLALLAVGCIRPATEPAIAPNEPLASDETPEQTLRSILAAAQAGDVRGIRSRLTGADEAYLDAAAELAVAMKHLDQAIEARFAAPRRRDPAAGAQPLPTETLDGGNVVIRLNEHETAFFARRDGRWKLFVADPLSEDILKAALVPELRRRIDAYDRTARDVAAGKYASPADAYRAVQARDGAE